MVSDARKSYGTTIPGNGVSFLCGIVFCCWLCLFVAEQRIRTQFFIVINLKRAGYSLLKLLHYMVSMLFIFWNKLPKVKVKKKFLFVYLSSVYQQFYRSPLIKKCFFYLFSFGFFQDASHFSNDPSAVIYPIHAVAIEIVQSINIIVINVNIVDIVNVLKWGCVVKVSIK